MERRVKEVADSVVISNLIYMAQEAASEEDRRMYLNYAMELMKKTKEGKRAMKYRNIIFDLDGTLIDTETAVLKTWQYTLKQNRRYFELDELRPALGLTIPNTLRKLGIVADPGFGGRWMENYGKYAGEAAFFDGVEETLAALKAGGYSLGIVTSRCREEYEAFFSSFRLESRFGCIVLADETKRHKPDPEPLLKYAQKAGVRPASCMYVGDMPTDVECANRAGMASGLAIWNRSKILCRQADFIFRTPEDLIGL